MLDKVSEAYNSRILDLHAQKKFAAVVITEEGVEIAAASDGFRFEYSGRWRDIQRSWAEIDKKAKARQAGSRIDVQEVREDGGDSAVSDQVN